MSALLITILRALMNTIPGALMNTILRAFKNTRLSPFLNTIIGASKNTILRSVSEHDTRCLAEHSTYLDAFLRLNQEGHDVEADDGVFDSLEEGATPVDGSGHRRVVLVQWGLVLVLVKQPFHQVHLHTRQSQRIQCVHV